MSKTSDPCLLFHGPTAQGRVSLIASEWGPVLGTFGDPLNGLNTQVIRDAIDLLSQPTVSDRRGSVILGPVDLLSQAGVLDAILKVVEESNPRLPRPYLWAWDAGSVQATIRSRCVMEWCPGPVYLDRKNLSQARLVIDACLSGSNVGVLSTFSEMRDEWSDNADNFFVCVSHLLSTQENVSALWDRVRPLLVSSKTPSYGEALVGFLP